MTLTRASEYFLYIAIIVLVLINSGNILFWDTVQFAGRHGQWFYENGIGSVFLPQEMDSGHPPFFGMYLAGCWKLFGRSLLVSHLSMLPFIGLIYFALRSIGKSLLDEKYVWLLWAWTLCPFFLGHLTLVSPDLVLLAGFSLVMAGSLSKKKKYMMIGGLLLGLISMRGFIVLFCCILYSLWQVEKRNWNWKSIISKVNCYGLGVIAFFLYQIAHLIHAQWIGFHNNSPWASSFSLVDISGLLKNSIVFFWRLLDYGMIIPWLVVVINYSRTKDFPFRKLAYLLLLILFIILVPFQGLMNHRYFLPLQLIIIMWACYSLKGKHFIYQFLLCLFLGLGNLIVYPDKIAQGWDSTAAHFPYYKLEQEFDNWRESQSIARTEIGTAFPLRGARIELDPEDGSLGYKPYDLDMDKYILYSNIMNDFTDEDLIQLEKWTTLWHKEIWNVKMTLLVRRSTDPTN